MSSVKLVNITKSFDEKIVLENINIDIKDGELVSLLGVSGCGKSTTLQLIAGLINPDSGDIIFNDKSVLNIPTGKREAVIVFQDYLLFPHMSVYENIEFGLKMKNINKKTRKDKVNELIKLVKLNGYENKYPSELSGGQKQRVAIARTLAINPKVLLLDEPFSNLDINLRNEMREFVLNLQKKLYITTILVTHDKEEALIMSDKIAVMVDGKIEQFDKPTTLYQNPKTKSVANIFGERNYIKGKIENEVFKSNILYIDAKGYNDLDTVEAMIPKECIKLYSANYNDGVNGYIQRKQYAGDKTFYDININGEVLKCTSISNEYNQGDDIKICIDRDNIVFFPL
ncbi:ABC transporter ATP-binding protein [Romboutsia ilealis]|uniref:ABC transporter ATP-binding protein n=1 Tax=Romboutsia ilealis TaxID=1115758 RepID=UPI002675CCBA|nr:ABC transporter ATP-binding protein [Romboutsia ilealis]